MSNPILRPLVAVLAFTSCGKGSPAPEATSDLVQDSANVTITMDTAPAVNKAHAWTVAATPSLTIGRADGPADQQLFRVWSAMRLGDGRIVVGNAGGFQVRFYDGAGKLLKTTGRYGAGPGEYQDVNQVFAFRGDSIGVYDNAMRRMAVYDRAGNFAYHMAMPQSAPFTRVLNVSGDGSMLFTAMDYKFFTTRPRMKERDLFVVRTTASSKTDTLGKYYEMDGEFGGQDHETYFLPWGGVASCGDKYISWRTDVYEARVHDEHGKLVRIMRRTFEPTVVTEAFFDQYKKDQMRELMAPTGMGAESRPPALMQQNIRRIERATHAKYLPAITDVQCDSEGDVWMRDSPLRDGPSRWSVFSPDGKWITQLTVPAGLRVLQIGPDFLLAHATDSDQVEQIRVFRLDRGRGR